MNGSNPSLYLHASPILQSQSQPHIIDPLFASSTTQYHQPMNGYSHSTLPFSHQQYPSQLQSQSQLSHPSTVAVNSHLQSLHDREVHDYTLRIASLEQLLYEREDLNHSMRVELERLKKREEQLLSEAELRNLAQKKQLDAVQTHVESLNAMRQEMSEKQRIENDKIKREMNEREVMREKEMKKKDEMLREMKKSEEENRRSQQNEIDELQAKLQKSTDAYTNTITSLEVEISTLNESKSNLRDQLAQSVKQNLTSMNTIKSMTRKYEEMTKKYEIEQEEMRRDRRRWEEELTAVRREYEQKDEELVRNLRIVENQLNEKDQAHQTQLSELQRDRDQLIEAHRRECARLLDESHQTQRQLTDEFTQKSSVASIDLNAARNRATHLERDLQEQRQQMAHESARVQESWKKAIEEKDRELASIKRDLMASQMQSDSMREKNNELEASVSEYRLQIVQLQTELTHTKSALEEAHTRTSELRTQHQKSDEERTADYTARIDALQSRLSQMESLHDASSRALELERLRSADVSSQLQLLRTSSANKMRAIEVARSLEQQSLLTDFASQLNRVRSEITAIKSQTPKDLQREWNHQKRERERERDRASDRDRAVDRDTLDDDTRGRSSRLSLLHTLPRSRSVSRDPAGGGRLSSPLARPQSAGSSTLATLHSPLLEPPRTPQQSSLSQRRERLRSIDNSPLITSATSISASLNSSRAT